MKVTGGQRIDLFGVKKEDLPAVWKDLSDAGFVSGHAYGKALRTVKTCVGSQWCRFGTQDSTGLGVKLEQADLGFVDAAQVQARRCPAARATAPRPPSRISAWSASIPATSCTWAATAASRCASPTCCARWRPRHRSWNTAAPSSSSTARRPTTWSAPRPGSSGSAWPIKQHVVDDAAGRAELFERFKFSQQFVQIDPWKERAEGKAAHEYESLATVA